MNFFLNLKMFLYIFVIHFLFNTKFQLKKKKKKKKKKGNPPTLLGQSLFNSKHYRYNFFPLSYV